MKKQLKRFSAFGFILFYSIIFQTLNLAQADKMKLDSLKIAIQEKFNSTEGTFAIAFEDLSADDNKLYINAHENFHAASTMKTPVMMEVFKQASMSKISLDDSILVENKFKSIVDSSEYSMSIGRDSGDGLYEYLGKNRTILELTYSMITVSSNLATNILIDLVKAENVMKTLKEIGANDIKVLRGVEDMKAYDLGLNNTTTAADLALVLKTIEMKKFLREDYCEKMLDILKTQKFSDLIPKLLPKDIIVAHKTGLITGVRAHLKQTTNSMKLQS
ncbi:MAG: class A beta-lactamase-related serine hydrolase [Bacteroidetes bacterium]|nr:class A beta-lactamase-related serine hydrolase [Bacteroidota bacterium]